MSIVTASSTSTQCMLNVTMGTHWARWRHCCTCQHYDIQQWFDLENALKVLQRQDSSAALTDTTTTNHSLPVYPVKFCSQVPLLLLATLLFHAQSGKLNAVSSYIPSMHAVRKSSFGSFCAISCYILAYCSISLSIFPFMIDWTSIHTYKSHAN